MWNEGPRTAVFHVIVTKKTETGIHAEIKTVKVEVEKPWTFDVHKTKEDLEQKFTNKLTKYVRAKFVGWENG
jgi:hypothetical protein